MSTILLLADEAHGARLKSDLEYIGRNVLHLPWNPENRSPLDSHQIDPPDIILIDAETVGDQLAKAVQHLRDLPRTRNAPLLVVADETTALNLDFSLGITDFITKPYSLREIEARLRLALWHSDSPGDEHIIKLDDLVINLVRYEVRVKGAIVDLTLKEYELLKYLAANQGRVFTRSDLLDRIWGYDYYGGMRTVDVHIRRLRSKLDEMGNAITTVRGVGYSFDLA